MSARPLPTVPFAADSWFKASASAAQNECVEVNTSVSSLVGVRDSKAPDAVLAFPRAAFTAAVDAVRDGAL
ncbi:DUF397 domain-containing protein [Streptomyces sp. NPDC006482]|uniref:DUF397 domain-containing protein n=1 Tax=Streptomyces sp. NPDC006482 TaxID=3154306 RepID=UPI0033AB5196